MGRNGKVDQAVIPEVRIPPCEGGDEAYMGPENPPWVIPAPAGSSGSWLSAKDDVLRVRCPTLHDFMTLAGYGGKARVTGSLSLFCEEGKFKASINDRDGGHVAFLSGDSLWGLLEAIDRGLKSGSLDWRVSQFAKKKK